MPAHVEHIGPGRHPVDSPPAVVILWSLPPALGRGAWRGGNQALAEPTFSVVRWHLGPRRNLRESRSVTLWNA